MSENKFSVRLSEAIKASGKSQTVIAKLAGITAPYLSDLKKGHKGNPSQEVLKKLADSLGTTPAWLMSYRDDAGISVVGGPGGKRTENAISEGNTNHLGGADVGKTPSLEYLERRTKFLAVNYPPAYLLDTVVAMLKDGEARQVAAEETLHKIEAALRLSGYW